MEIERKFLVDSRPSDLDKYDRVEIEQAYISVDPSIRLRKSNDNYIFTIKQKGLLAREEFEMPLTEEQYEHLWPKVETNVIMKTRYLIPIHDGKTAEFDVYYGALSGLLTVEVEFDSIEQANSFKPPEWFGLDVTNDPKYKNSTLAVNNFY